MTEPDGIVYGRQNYPDERGLTKREYFAAMAMQGIKSNPELCRLCDEAAKRSGTTQQEAIAHMAVIDADALIKELNKKS